MVADAMRWTGGCKKGIRNRALCRVCSVQCRNRLGQAVSQSVVAMGGLEDSCLRVSSASG